MISVREFKDHNYNSNIDLDLKFWIRPWSQEATRNGNKKWNKSISEYLPPLVWRGEKCFPLTEKCVSNKRES